MLVSESLEVQTRVVEEQGVCGSPAMVHLTMTSSLKMILELHIA